MRKLLVALAMSAFVFPSVAQAMSVAEFLTKADKLKAMGMMAMMSSDVGLLQNEVKMASTSWRADVDAARAKGRTDLGCPPPKGQVKMNSDDLIAAFRAVPKTQAATMSVKQAIYQYMRGRFPCR